MMRRQPSYSCETRHQKQSGSAPTEAADDHRGKRPKRDAALPSQAAAEPKDEKKAVNQPAERVPVQRFVPVSVSEADKSPCQPAAGAGESGQIIKWAKRGQMADLTRAARQWQQDAGREDGRQNSPMHAGVGTNVVRLRHSHGRGLRGWRGVWEALGGGGQEFVSGGGLVMAAFQIRLRESCCKTGLISPTLANPPIPMRSRIR